MASEACRALPAVVTTDYKPKGTNVQIGSLKTCMRFPPKCADAHWLMAYSADVTGDQQSQKGIIDVYDIFGNAPQTFQGADMLAEGLGAVVIVPDFFKGETLPPDTFPPDTDEKKQIAGNFLAEHANVPKNMEALLQTAAEAKKQWPSVKNWGAFGLASAEGSPFAVSGTAHPGRLDKEDALKLTIPHIILASPGEPVEVLNAYAETFKNGDKVGEVETYHTMFHGWMGARADLQNPENAKEFERG
jgi:dienelactone hydrolase